MIGLALLAMAATPICRVEHATYVLRSNPAVTIAVEEAPVNADWQQGVVVAIHGAGSGDISYWLPWFGGTDDGRHIRRTVLLDKTKDRGSQQRSERGVDLDFFALDSRYTFLRDLPMRGSAAPAHILIPDLDLWHGGDPLKPRDASPRAFFDLTGCNRSTAHDRGRDAILPSVA